jgi:hypothetical protein
VALGPRTYMQPIPDDVQAEQLKLELRLRTLEAHDRATTGFLDFFNIFVLGLLHHNFTFFLS